ncbi:MAG: carbon-nitrogen hydrolase family protein [Xanthomonadales bacterium]|jgi:predicted amidohydrolase|nr:carbon-nitrogen hydrolase family protein [Xanthomonadales bacterium]
MAYLSMAALQLELGIEDNLSLIEHEIDLVKKRFPWVQLVVLPELCTFGPSTDLAVSLPGEVENCFREAALKNAIWLIPGSIFERRGQEVFNTAPVINPQGQVVARYRKQYPFLPYEKGVSAGDQFVVFDIPGAGRIGLIICYDMWFPETVRTLAWMGAEAIICPSLTNTIDREVELAIARSNAATNQVYFLNLNSAGRLAVGQTIFVGPDGQIIHQAGSGREIITVEMDFEHVRRVRERGLHGLCQTLKSFRDHRVEFPPYRQAQADPGAFGELGVLAVPRREPLTGPVAELKVAE